VIVVECHSDAEAARAQALLPARRVVWTTRTSREHLRIRSSRLRTKGLEKLSAWSTRLFAPVTQLTNRPLEDVMSHVESIDSPELKQAVQEAIKKISTATGLHSTQIVDVFKEKRASDVNIVACFMKEARASPRRDRADARSRDGTLAGHCGTWPRAFSTCRSASSRCSQRFDTRSRAARGCAAKLERRWSGMHCSRCSPSWRSDCCAGSIRYSRSRTARCAGVSYFLPVPRPEGGVF